VVTTSVGERVRDSGNLGFFFFVAGAGGGKKKKKKSVVKLSIHSYLCLLFSNSPKCRQKKSPLYMSATALAVQVRKRTCGRGCVGVTMLTSVALRGDDAKQLRC